MKRYHVMDDRRLGIVSMDEDTDGDWVKYKEADARIAELEAERDRLREALEANMPVIEAAEEIGNNSLAVQTCLHRVKDGEGEEFEYLIADLAEALADRDSRYAARQALQPKERA